jgi:hypothetical protein
MINFQMEKVSGFTWTACSSTESFARNLTPVRLGIGSQGNPGQLEDTLHKYLQILSALSLAFASLLPGSVPAAGRAARNGEKLPLY